LAIALFIFSHVELPLSTVFQEFTLPPRCYFCCESSNPITEGSFMYFLFLWII